MPRISLRLAPGLEDLLRPRRRGPLVVSAPPGATLLAVIEDLGVPRTEVGAVTVNGRPARLDERAGDGDEVAVGAAPPQPCEGLPAFLLDVHLGRLARLLRMLGFDAAWRRDAGDAELAAASARELRILLSRDRGLLKRREVHRGCLVRSQDPGEQLAQVLDRYGLRQRGDPFSRCLACNARLERTPAGGAAEVRGTAGRCPECGRRYWRGSHREAMGRQVARIRRGG